MKKQKLEVRYAFEIYKRTLNIENFLMIIFKTGQCVKIKIKSKRKTQKRFIKFKYILYNIIDIKTSLN